MAESLELGVDNIKHLVDFFFDTIRFLWNQIVSSKENIHPKFHRSEYQLVKKQLKIIQATMRRLNPEIHFQFSNFDNIQLILEEIHTVWEQQFLTNQLLTLDESQFNCWVELKTNTRELRTILQSIYLDIA